MSRCKTCVWNTCPDCFRQDEDDACDKYLYDVNAEAVPKVKDELPVVDYPDEVRVVPSFKRQLDEVLQAALPSRVNAFPFIDENGDEIIDIKHEVDPKTGKLMTIKVLKPGSAW